MFPIYRHRKFNKQFKQLPKKIKERFEQRIRIFIRDPYSVELNNHPLTAEWAGYRSIDITGNIRAVYKTKDETSTFVAIGSHSQLYD